MTCLRCLDLTTCAMDLSRISEETKRNYTRNQNMFILFEEPLSLHNVECGNVFIGLVTALSYHLRNSLCANVIA